MVTIIRPEVPLMKVVVRVAVSNNFNCTAPEWAQLGEFSRKFPYKYFFVNCNIRTPRLLTINDHDYKAVITANPDLVPDDRLIGRLAGLDQSKVGFIRVKWLPANTAIQDLIERLLEDGYPVVVTKQRFNSKKSLYTHTDGVGYKWTHNRYRLVGESLEALHQFVDQRSYEGLYICDRAGVGCQGCRLCATLTYGPDVSLRSLNLSSSGVCKYNCPDCYAHAIQQWLAHMDQPLIHYDEVKANKKQKGDTAHIREAQGALCQKGV